MSPVSDDGDNLRRQLELEHEERLARFEERRASGKDRARESKDRKRRSHRHKAESAMRLEFYKEKGYKKYVDSRGREQWLPPQEFEWRTKARKAREARQKKYGGLDQGKHAHVWLMVSAALIAVVLGLLLIR